MPITPGQLETGDILFKHASKSAISRLIAAGQKSVYQQTVATVGAAPVSQAEACDITHVAMAAGRDDVLEFDEGSSSKLEIVFAKGKGFVRGPMSLPSRKGNRYEVFHCTSPKLAATAADKAELIYDITHQGPATASYGLAKVVNTGVRQERGGKVSLEYFENQLETWLQACQPASGVSAIFKKKPNLQFFCSEFVTFCYTWAAAECYPNFALGADYVIGVDRVRLSPVELYLRVQTVGIGNFKFKGTLYMGG
jgi:hypothetical protein